MTWVNFTSPTLGGLDDAHARQLSLWEGSLGRRTPTPQQCRNGWFGLGGGNQDLAFSCLLHQVEQRPNFPEADRSQRGGRTRSLMSR
jgi:hypothetical protein